MTAKEVAEIVKESNLWETLTKKEQQDAINHALEMIRALEPEDKRRYTV